MMDFIADAYWDCVFFILTVGALLTQALATVLTVLTNLIFFTVGGVVLTTALVLFLPFCVVSRVRRWLKGGY